MSADELISITHELVNKMKVLGKTPTKFILGADAKLSLEQHVKDSGFTMIYDPRFKGDEFMGLPIEWTAENGIKIE